MKGPRRDRPMTDPMVFDELERQLMDQGPSAAISRLCALLRERKDYSNLFYALLLKKRHELGVSLIPTGPAEDLPESALHILGGRPRQFVSSKERRQIGGRSGRGRGCHYVAALSRSTTAKDTLPYSASLALNMIFFSTL